MRLLTLLVLLVIGGGLGFAAARMVGDGAAVVVREGNPQVPPGQTALIILQGEFVAELVRAGLEDSDMPVIVQDVHTAFVREGIAVSGRAVFSAAGVVVRPGFSAIARPVASGDGTIAVQIREVRAVGAPLPGVFEGALERVINRQLREATAVEGYVVTEVEVGPGELLVYLEYAAEG
jgi:hypothetical protein